MSNIIYVDFKKQEEIDWCQVLDDAFKEFQREHNKVYKEQEVVKASYTLKELKDDL